MFIKFKDITNEITIDVRTRSEFNNMKLFQYNIPVIKPNESKILTYMGIIL